MKLLLSVLLAVFLIGCEQNSNQVSDIRVDGDTVYASRKVYKNFVPQTVIKVGEESKEVNDGDFVIVFNRK